MRVGNTDLTVASICAAVAAAIVTYALSSKKLQSLGALLERVAPRLQRFIAARTRTVLYLFMAAALGYVAVTAHDNAVENRRTHVVMCAYRTDLVKKMTDENLELAHPFEFGTTPSARTLILSTLKTQQRTLNSLRGLHCDS